MSAQHDTSMRTKTTLYQTGGFHHEKASSTGLMTVVQRVTQTIQILQKKRKRFPGMKTMRASALDRSMEARLRAWTTSSKHCTFCESCSVSQERPRRQLLAETFSCAATPCQRPGERRPAPNQEAMLRPLSERGTPPRMLERSLPLRLTVERAPLLGGLGGRAGIGGGWEGVTTRYSWRSWLSRELRAALGAGEGLSGQGASGSSCPSGGGGGGLAELHGPSWQAPSRISSGVKHAEDVEPVGSELGASTPARDMVEIRRRCLWLLRC